MKPIRKKSEGPCARKSEGPCVRKQSERQHVGQTVDDFDSVHLLFGTWCEAGRLSASVERLRLELVRSWSVAAHRVKVVERLLGQLVEGIALGLQRACGLATIYARLNAAAVIRTAANPQMLTQLRNQSQITTTVPWHSDVTRENSQHSSTVY